MSSGDGVSELLTDAYGKKLTWEYGRNDHIEELPADRLKEFKPTNNFRTDYASLSSGCGIVVHPGFVPPPPASGKGGRPPGGKRPTPDNDPDVGPDNGGPVLTLHSILVGRAAMLVFRHIIPTSSHIEVLRLTSCCLDIESVGLLRAGLTESCSIAVLQLDWNPVEVPVDVAALRTAFEAGQKEEIDEIEKKREQLQAERILRSFGEMLTSRFGDVPTAMKAIHRAAIKDRLHHEATAGVEPFPSLDLGRCFPHSLEQGNRRG